MKKITRDIQLTLIIKFLLLMALWIVCFKSAEKNTVGLAQWLYGAPAKTSIPPKPLNRGSALTSDMNSVFPKSTVQKDYP